jgi:transposase
MTMTATALADRAHDGMVSDDALAKPKRRNFSAAYKLAILDQYEALEDPGAKGAFLRREGLYSSHIVEWRRARDVGALAELAPKVRRSKASGEQRELQRLRKKNARLEDLLDRHRKALEIQGKATELLAKLLAESTDDERQPRPSD